MGTRLYSGVVVVFWAATMSWLVVDKVWPTLRVGEPPSYRSILKPERVEPPICWAIEWNDRPAGWAAGKIIRREDGMSEMHNRVFIEELPIDQLAPGWLGALVKPVLRRAGRLDMDARSRVEIDPLGRLVGFDSNVRLAHIPDAVRMQGVIDGNRLKLSAQSGDFAYKTEKYLTPEALVGDALSPQAKLPGLHIGQRWTMPVYSPFRPPNSPMEILEAVVERHELIIWNGESVDTLLVIYRTDAGASLLSEPRGKLWVRSDGFVLKQEVQMFNSHMQFTRLAASKSRQVAEVLAPHGTGDLPLEVSKQLLHLVRD